MKVKGVAENCSGLSSLAITLLGSVIDALVGSVR
jgi:hypothetical protein